MPTRAPPTPSFDGSAAVIPLRISKVGIPASPGYTDGHAALARFSFAKVAKFPRDGHVRAADDRERSVSLTFDWYTQGVK
jgi:hypothetical protein